VTSTESHVPLVLLCGGENRRLASLSGTIYKPFLDLNGSSLVARHLARAALSGQNTVQVIVDELDPLLVSIIRGFEATQGLDVGVMELRGTARAKISGAVSALGREDGPIVVALGDTYCWYDVSEMLRLIGDDAEACIAVGEYRERFGVVSLNDDLVSSFDEKPALGNWINLGVMAFSSTALDMLRSGEEVTELLTGLAQGGKLAAHRVPGNYVTLDSLPDIALALRRDPGEVS
jgi:NDP-sugar pyrophosphorylase family protein